VGTMIIGLPIRNVCTVHPHGRGDNDVRDLRAVHNHGSPPRAWGQSRSHLCRYCRNRFTPTGVGTIACVVAFEPVSSVHPHGRGDNFINVSFHGTQNGSPPRAWGQFVGTTPIRNTLRFTPTGVGTITRQRTARARESGSPPRAWGQSLRFPLPTEHERFTPTGVGTIDERGRVTLPPTVHPHGRGDNPALVVDPAFEFGSPPRAWGQCQNVAGYRLDKRFTPTGVGTIRCQKWC